MEVILLFLSMHGLEARRRQQKYQGGAGVYIKIALTGGFMLEIEVIDCYAKYTAKTCSLQIGVAQCPKGPYKHLDIPYNIDSWAAYGYCFCTWQVNTIHNGLDGSYISIPYGSVNLHDLRKGDRVGLHLTTSGDLSFSFNGTNLGIAAENVYRNSEVCDTYPVIGIFGSTRAVRITEAG